MDNRLNPVVLLAALAFSWPSAARTQEALDVQSYWFGFLLGSAVTVCELYRNGQINKELAKEWLSEALGADDEIPAVSIARAKAALVDDAQYKACPLPR
jgi:hypothetical protein